MGTNVNQLRSVSSILIRRSRLLIYKVDESKQIVFRSSVVKMDIAAKMSMSTHFFEEEFLSFQWKS